VVNRWLLVIAIRLYQLTRPLFPWRPPCKCNPGGPSCSERGLALARQGAAGAAIRKSFGALTITAALVMILGASGGGCAGSSHHGPPASGLIGQEQQYAQTIGHYTDAEMSCLISLWNQESGWSAWAVNSSSGAYGIPQALPAAWGHPFQLGYWRSQIRWGIWYIATGNANGYDGNPCNAWTWDNDHGLEGY
jgi:hypothetical protein